MHDKRLAAYNFLSFSYAGRVNWQDDIATSASHAGHRAGLGRGGLTKFQIQQRG